ncbi:M23 family metallopeptidase [Paenibacillus puerhi]|uniref:M23 family metallopeptidase n=1 Tax=Paenibacillus puerhi TaxID=2692622 RepID=UPI00135A0B49|nr:M23 family metallopeptidase [Paenibacillus puerhi]
MNLKWFHDKLTFLIIPDANASVVRFKLSRGAVCCAVLAALAVAGTAVCLYARQLYATAATFHRTHELDGKTVRLEQALLSKNRRIEELQSEVLSLSKQAAQVRSRVEEMKKLEKDLQLLAPRPSGEKAGSTSPPPSVPAFFGMGGPSFPAKPEDIRRLAADAGRTFAWLELEMDRLAEGWTEARSKLLERQDRLRRTPSLWPTVSRVVTSPYGYRKDPFTRKLSFHRGIDIAGKLDDPIFAAAGGTVYTVGYDKLHGHHVIIEHAEGLRTWYMHLNHVAVAEGQQLDKGQTIGGLGTTGRSTGPHLHYEILREGKSTDPGKYLPGDNTEGSLES